MIKTILKAIGLGFGGVALLTALLMLFIYLMQILLNLIVMFFGFGLFSAFSAVILPMAIVYGVMFSIGAYFMLKND